MNIIVRLDETSIYFVYFVVKNLFSYILVPGMVSYFVTRLFWVNSFKSRSSKIEFASFIGRKDDNSLFVRFMNTGKKDLIDAKYITRLRYRRRKKDGGDDGNYNVTLWIGLDNSDPVIHGKQRHIKESGRRFYWNKEILLTDECREEFTKSGHPEMLKDREINLNDILNEYGDDAQIKVYVFGIDTATGVERMFESPSYTHRNIRNYMDFVSEPYNRKKSFRKYCERMLNPKSGN